MGVVVKSRNASVPFSAKNHIICISNERERERERESGDIVGSVGFGQSEKCSLSRSYGTGLVIKKYKDLFVVFGDLFTII